MRKIRDGAPESCTLFADFPAHEPYAPQIRAALKDLRLLRAPLPLAPEMGAGLGGGEILLRALPENGEGRAMTGILRPVLGDQLTWGLASLADLAEGDVVLMAEVGDETT